MKKTARSVAVTVLDDIEKNDAYANISLDRHLSISELEKKERALATELVYGTLRNRGYIDWILETLAQKGLAGIDDKLINILRSAVYQIKFLDRVPDFAAVDEAVRLSKKAVGPYIHRFVNGILRAYVRKKDKISPPSIQDDPIAGISTRYSFPKWLVRRWLAEYGEKDTLSICRFFNTPPPLTVRVNSLRSTRDELADSLKSQGISAEPSDLSPTGLNLHGIDRVDEIKEFTEGLFTVQDTSSMLVAPVVNPLSGNLLIDACSAPGGKSTHMAELINDTGSIISIDIYEHKLRLLQNAALRLGLNCIQTLLWDATKPLDVYHGKADCVLIDAPCSGLGVLNRRPDARWRKSENDIPKLVKLQRSIMHAMARCVKPGGTLVYSTCTITKEENQENVESFLNEHDDFQPSAIGPFIPNKLRSTDRRVDNTDFMIQLMPHIHNIDGFFIARMTRKP